MYSKDKKEHSVVVNLTRNILAEYRELENIYKDYAKKTFGKDTLAFIEKDNYGSDSRYKFTIKLKERALFPKETHASLTYLVKWVITDLKIKILKRASTMYGFFASKHKIINGK